MTAEEAKQKIEEEIKMLERRIQELRMRLITIESEESLCPLCYKVLDDPQYCNWCDHYFQEISYHNDRLSNLKLKSTPKRSRS